MIESVLFDIPHIQHARSRYLSQTYTTVYNVAVDPTSSVRGVEILTGKKCQRIACIPRSWHLSQTYMHTSVYNVVVDPTSSTKGV
jgi:hypothetical protein